MARKTRDVIDQPIGPLLLWNLYRLGYADIVARSSEVAELVAKKAGKGITRQRISALMNAVRIEPETIELIAKGLGVKPAELTRTDDIPPKREPLH
jgi:hypothetical protein